MAELDDVRHMDLLLQRAALSIGSELVIHTSECVLPGSSRERGQLVNKFARTSGVLARK